MPKPKQTKIGKVQALLRRPAGATLDTLMNATGWQAHSVRAALSTLRRSGIKIERRVPDGSDAATYHIVDHEAAT